ncbi:MAG: hypothetical protein DI553_00675, partial [Cutibacterium acnes]
MDSGFARTDRTAPLGIGERGAYQSEHHEDCDGDDRLLETVFASCSQSHSMPHGLEVKDFNGKTANEFAQWLSMFLVAYGSIPGPAKMGFFSQKLKGVSHEIFDGLENDLKTVGPLE